MSSILKYSQLAALLCLGAFSCQKGPQLPVYGKWQVDAVRPANGLKAPETADPIQLLALSAAPEQMKPVSILITDKNMTLFTQGNDSTSLTYNSTGQRGNMQMLNSSEGAGTLERLNENKARLTIADATYELTRATNHPN